MKRSEKKSNVKKEFKQDLTSVGSASEALENGSQAIRAMKEVALHLMTTIEETTSSLREDKFFFFFWLNQISEKNKNTRKFLQ